MVKSIKHKNTIPVLFRKSILATAISLAISTVVNAATVRSDVDYQDFRDLSENKGRFVVGAKNVIVYDIKGNPVGMLFNGAPVPDFSSTHRLTGTTTLVDPQYVVSVAHNNDDNLDAEHWHFSIQFGGQSQNPDAHHYDYAFVATNDDKHSFKSKDYQHPRLAKLVTEVEPVAMAKSGAIADYTTDRRYSAFARVGSGLQNVQDKEGTTQRNYQADGTLVCDDVNHCRPIADAYTYLVAGEPLKFVSDGFFGFLAEGELLSGGKEALQKDGKPLNHLYATPMANLSESGDSGSPIYGYNTKNKQWELIAVHAGRMETKDLNNGVEVFSYAIPTRPNFLETVKNADKVETNSIISNDKKNYVWKYDSQKNANILTLGYFSTETATNLHDANLKDTVSKSGFERLIKHNLNNGKNLSFDKKDGVLTLEGNINQGAGALYFDENFTVNSTNPTDTWLGAGVSVAEDKVVDWKVHNPKDDRLSKIGKGTLKVSGKGVNLGSISVGDGTVILAQTPIDGKIQAFDEVGIVSGRPTVVLTDDKQVDVNNIYFGYRGGRLDVHGNNIMFKRIQNVDEGAQIVNHNQDAKAVVNIVGMPESKAISIPIFGGEQEGFYRLRGFPSYLPQKGKDSLDFVYLGDGKDNGLFDAYNHQVNQQNAITFFNGVFGETDDKRHNGALDVVYEPTSHKSDAKFVITGGTNLNGDLIAKSGAVVLSGRPVSHATDFVNGKEIIKESEWINRNFYAKNFDIRGNSKLFIGRNVEKTKGDFKADENAQIILGYAQGLTPVCIRSDYHGEATCQANQYDTKVWESMPTTQAHGNIQLQGNSSFVLAKAHLMGKAIASKNTTIDMLSGSRWSMQENSRIGHLKLANGSVVDLGARKDGYNTLVIDGDLSGQGRFLYHTDLAELLSDKVVVGGRATGDYVLDVKNSGSVKPKSKDSLILLDLNEANQQGVQDLQVRLANGQVDLGAFRYTLVKNNADYGLYSAGLEKTLEEAEAKRKAEEAEAKRKAEEEKRKAEEEKRKAEEAEAKRKAEEEKRKAEEAEAKRKAEEAEAKRKAEEEKRKAEEEKRKAEESIDYIGQNLSDYLVDAKTTRPDSKTQLWLHNSYTKTDHASDYYRHYTHNQHVVQLGLDKAINVDSFDALVGGALTYTKHDHSFDDNGKNKGDMAMLSLYGKAQLKHQIFVAFDGGYGKDKSKIYLDNDTILLNRHVNTLGLNVGKGFTTPSLVNIQPSFGVRRHYVEGVNYTLNGADINIGSLELFSYRAGLSLDKTFVLSNGLMFSPKFATYYVVTTDKRASIDVNDSKLDQEFGDYGQYQAGFELSGKKWAVSFGTTYAKGDEMKKSQSGDVQITYRW